MAALALILGTSAVHAHRYGSYPPAFQLEEGLRCVSFCDDFQALPPGTNATGAARLYAGSAVTVGSLDVTLPDANYVPLGVEVEAHVHVSACNMNWAEVPTEQDIFLLGARTFKWALVPSGSSARYREASYEGLVPDPAAGAGSVVVHDKDYAKYACCTLQSCAPPAQHTCHAACRDWVVHDSAAAVAVTGLAEVHVATAPEGGSWVLVDVTLRGEASAAAARAPLLARVYRGAPPQLGPAWEDVAAEVPGEASPGIELLLGAPPEPGASRIKVGYSVVRLPRSEPGGELRSIVLSMGGDVIASCVLRECGSLPSPATAGEAGPAAVVPAASPVASTDSRVSLSVVVLIIALAVLVPLMGLSVCLALRWHASNRAVVRGDRLASLPPSTLLVDHSGEDSSAWTRISPLTPGKHEPKRFADSSKIEPPLPPGPPGASFHGIAAPAYGGRGAAHSSMYELVASGSRSGTSRMSRGEGRGSGWEGGERAGSHLSSGGSMVRRDEEGNLWRMMTTEEQAGEADPGYLPILKWQVRRRGRGGTGGTYHTSSSLAAEPSCLMGMLSPLGMSHAASVVPQSNPQSLGGVSPPLSADLRPPPWVLNPAATQPSSLPGMSAATTTAAGGSSVGHPASVLSVSAAAACQAAIHGLLDSYIASGSLFYNKYYLLPGVENRRDGGQGVVAFARRDGASEGGGTRGGGDAAAAATYAIKFFTTRALFSAERRMYGEPSLQRLLPEVRDIEANERCWLLAPDGTAVPPFVVMERGESFEEWCLRSKPDFPTALQVMMHVAEALMDLHDAGYAHGDVKPSNLIWSSWSNRWMLIDFASARRIGREGRISCTLAYAAPEVMRELRAGHTSMVTGPEMDVWALGVMMWAMLTDIDPWDDLEEVPQFRGETVVFQQMMVQRILGETRFPWEADPLPAVAKSRLGILGASVLSMLRRDPRRRPTLRELRMLWTRIFHGGR